MDKAIGVDHGKGKPVIGIFGANGLEVVCTANSNNTFDIVQPSNGKYPGALCYKCANFIKEGDCKKNELRGKGTEIKLHSCKVFF